jgi:LmbE family N-acetylglucosaminyl deacetylase
MSASEPGARPIFLAPHYDDVALSCGGTVAALADAGESPLVLTVFGGEPSGSLNSFAADMHQRWGVGPAGAIALRREEEVCAARVLGVESRWLDLPDAIYRGERYLSDDDLFGAVHPEETVYWRVILGEVLGFLDTESVTASRFYVPLGLGNHVDHQLVLAAGRVLWHRGYEVIAYEDYPYAGDPESDPLRLGRERSRRDPVVKPLSDEHLERRRRAILCYASQLGVIFRHQGDPEAAVRRYAERVGDGRPAERFWPLG